jgi:hypothetical protein
VWGHDPDVEVISAWEFHGRGFVQLVASRATNPSQVLIGLKYWNREMLSDMRPDERPL